MPSRVPVGNIGKAKERFRRMIGIDFELIGSTRCIIPLRIFVRTKHPQGLAGLMPSAYSPFVCSALI